jgi:hypothetical protein
MATIELDIIKQRSDKLLPKEKIELINYIAASLTPEEIGKLKKMPDFAKSIPTKTQKPPKTPR